MINGNALSWRATPGRLSGSRRQPRPNARRTPSASGRWRPDIDSVAAITERDWLGRHGGRRVRAERRLGARQLPRAHCAAGADYPFECPYRTGGPASPKSIAESSDDGSPRYLGRLLRSCLTRISPTAAKSA